MRCKVNPWAVGAVVCAMTPNLLAVASVLRGFVQPMDPGSMDPRSFGVVFALWTVAITTVFGFIGMPNYLTGPMGAAGMVLAVVAIKKSGLGGKMLAAAALVLGTLEVVLVGLRLTI